MRRWDAQTLTNTETYNSNKAVYCVAAAAATAAAVAFAGADRAWRLWDSRQSRKEDMVRLLLACVLALHMACMMSMKPDSRAK